VRQVDDVKRDVGVLIEVVAGGPEEALGLAAFQRGLLQCAHHPLHFGRRMESG
jgi:hypothetical protein